MRLNYWRQISFLYRFFKRHPPGTVPLQSKSKNWPELVNTVQISELSAIDGGSPYLLVVLKIAKIASPAITGQKNQGLCHSLRSFYIMVPMYNIALPQALLQNTLSVEINQIDLEYSVNATSFSRSQVICNIFSHSFFQCGTQYLWLDQQFNGLDSITGNLKQESTFPHLSPKRTYPALSLQKRCWSSKPFCAWLRHTPLVNKTPKNKFSFIVAIMF